jgi:RNA polymerase sigma factor (sigma-70 family)
VRAMSVPLRNGQADEDAAASAPGAVELEMLYRDQRHALMRFFARYRASPEDALDLTQEAFLRLFGSDALRSGAIAHAEAFLRTIARNLMLNRVKAAMRHKDADHVDISEQIVAGPSEIARLKARDSLAQLDAAMRSMNPKTRDIFMAHRVQGMTYREIAKHFGISTKSVEKQMARALAHVSRLVDLD